VRAEEISKHGGGFIVKTMSNNTDKITYRVPNGLKIIGYGLDNRGDRIPAEVKSVSSIKTPRTASCAISTGVILSRG